MPKRELATAFVPKTKIPPSRRRQMDRALAHRRASKVNDADLTLSDWIREAVARQAKRDLKL